MIRIGGNMLIGSKRTKTEIMKSMEDMHEAMAKLIEVIKVMSAEIDNQRARIEKLEKGGQSGKIILP